MTAINDLVTAGQFFVIITVELVILFIGISFLVGLIREYVPEEKIRTVLTSKHRGMGNIFGAFFGVLLPFVPVQPSRSWSDCLMSVSRLALHIRF
jgi:hypothetical protein